MKNMILSVSEINSKINESLRKNNKLWNCWVAGEISNYKDHIPSGHWYFTLKDETAGIRAVMFKSKNLAAGFKLQNGMSVIIRGSVRLYEKDGSVQLYAEEIYPGGLGALHLAYEQLKEKLAQEGLFAAEKKKPIPKYPDCVGIVTSSTGAALADILNIAGRRNPRISLIIFPAAVQGESAPREIAQAIQRANSYQNIDLLIVCRGGGSLEELWAFNTEEVARAIYHSVIPVISAVGHEIDYTIADFVADLRAPTPSAAAEISVPVLADIQAGMCLLEEKLFQRISNILKNKSTQLNHIKSCASLARPGWKLEQVRQDLDMLVSGLQVGMTGFLKQRNDILKLSAAKLELLSPLNILGRGYALTYKTDGSLLKSAKQARQGEELYVRFKDGTIDCTVNKVGTTGKRSGD